MSVDYLLVTRENLGGAELETVIDVGGSVEGLELRAGGHENEPYIAVLFNHGFIMHPLPLPDILVIGHVANHFPVIDEPLASHATFTGNVRG